MGHSAGVSVWERSWEKSPCVSRLWFCRGLVLCPAQGEGQMGMLWLLGRSQGALLGQDQQVQQFQSFAQCRQEKCCVLGAKQGLSNKGPLHIPCKIPRRAWKLWIWLISLGDYKIQQLSCPLGCRPLWPFSPTGWFWGAIPASAALVQGDLSAPSLWQGCHSRQSSAQSTLQHQRRERMWLWYHGLWCWSCRKHWQWFDSSGVPEEPMAGLLSWKHCYFGGFPDWLQTKVKGRKNLKGWQAQKVIFPPAQQSLWLSEPTAIPPRCWRNDRAGNQCHASSIFPPALSGCSCLRLSLEQRSHRLNGGDFLHLSCCWCLCCCVYLRSRSVQLLIVLGVSGRAMLTVTRKSRRAKLHVLLSVMSIANWAVSTKFCQALKSRGPGCAGKRCNGSEGPN